MNGILIYGYIILKINHWSSWIRNISDISMYITQKDKKRNWSQLLGFDHLHRWAHASWCDLTIWQTHGLVWKYGAKSTILTHPVLSCYVLLYHNEYPLVISCITGISAINDIPSYRQHVSRNISTVYIRGKGLMGCNGHITGIQYSPMAIFQNWGPKFSSKSNLLYPPVVKHGLLENCLYIVFYVFFIL